MLGGIEKRLPLALPAALRDDGVGRGIVRQQVEDDDEEEEESPGG